MECSLVEVEGSVTIKDATSSDLRFIESIGSREFWLSALGYDVIDSLALDAVSRKSRDAETQHRASVILGIMMTAAEAEEPHDARLAVKPWERSQSLGSALWSLAQNNEASSYASYAAYFSGSVYLAGFLEEFGKKDVNAMREFVIHDSRYEQAEAALSFAAEHADVYLKPRVMLFLAILKAIAGDKEGFDRTIQRSIDAVPGEGVQKRQIEDVRKEITDWFAKSK